MSTSDRHFEVVSRAYCSYVCGGAVGKHHLKHCGPYYLATTYHPRYGFQCSHSGLFTSPILGGVSITIALPSLVNSAQLTRLPFAVFGLPVVAKLVHHSPMPLSMSFTASPSLMLSISEALWGQFTSGCFGEVLLASQEKVQPPNEPQTPQPHLSGW